MEVTSVEASTTKIRGKSFRGSFYASMEAPIASMEASVEAVKALMEAMEASMEAFMSFPQKCR